MDPPDRIAFVILNEESLYLYLEAIVFVDHFYQIDGEMLHLPSSAASCMNKINDIGMLKGEQMREITLKKSVGIVFVPVPHKL